MTYQPKKQLQLFPIKGGWAILNEMNFRISRVIKNFAEALVIAKKMAQKNYASLLVRSEDGDVLFNSNPTKFKQLR